MYSHDICRIIFDYMYFHASSQTYKILLLAHWRSLATSATCCCFIWVQADESPFDQGDCLRRDVTGDERDQQTCSFFFPGGNKSIDSHLFLSLSASVSQILTVSLVSRGCSEMSKENSASYHHHYDRQEQPCDFRMVPRTQVHSTTSYYDFSSSLAFIDAGITQLV
jgi:hypothetical protein